MEGQTWHKSVRDSLRWHSSPIDWCEPNYAVTSSVVEFYNTVSNGIFVVLPAVLMLLFHPYSRRVSNRIQFVWLMMIVIGLTSAYFHATLTLAGQLLDEFSIIWMCAACIAFYFPKTLLPVPLQQHRSRFEILMLLVTALITYLGCLWPFLNSFLMMLASIPIVLLMRKEMKLSRSSNARYVARYTMICWALAAVVWVADRFSCSAWLRFGLPGGHWLWHILSAIAGYRGIVFFIYRDAILLHKNSKPTLEFWPSQRFPFLSLIYVNIDTSVV